jgi:hypothetical protein
VRPGEFGFLVVGAGRGGTSLLAGLLDCHPALEVGFEHASVATLMGAEVPGLDPGTFERRVDAFVDACRREAARHPDQRWGNKITTEQVHGLEDHNRANPAAPLDVLDAFFNRRLAGVKVVFILRDGRSCVASKVRRTGQPLALACERWRYSVRCHDFFRERHPDNLRLRFEDLVARPEETLGGVCAYLGVPWRPEMLEGVRNHKMLPEYRSGGLDVSKTRVPELPAEHLADIAADLRRCGYLA